MADDERLLWEWAAKQTYIALGNMMTAASFIGIDSCPIEGFHDDEVNDVLVKHGLIDPDKENSLPWYPLVIVLANLNINVSEKTAVRW